MRFVYGFILGVLGTVIAAILYLAFAGGDYLLQLSPRYHEMVSTIEALKQARGQRDQLASRLETLADSFEALTRRFNELHGTTREAAQPSAEPGTTASPRAETTPPSP
jgi:hypothetical protein